MLSETQCKAYEEQGFLHIPQVFSPDEMAEMDGQLETLLNDWAQTDMGWTGPWRDAYMDAATSEKSKLTHLHDLHFYSEAWTRAMVSPRLTEALGDLLGPNVELHHTTLHMKPPQTGHPFPLHQDNAFYEHTDGRYIDVLVHLDDTCHENGEIRFLAGSHKDGYLPHITQTPEGECTPHLSTEAYRLEDTVAVPAKRGDVVLFNIFTVHGSYINQTNAVRRLVRCGFRDPANPQIRGQSVGRPGLMVRGMRPRGVGQMPFPQEAIA